MAKTDKSAPPAGREEDSRRYGRWLYLLFLLFIVALISSGIAGYLLGLKASPIAGGQLIDTILLEPEVDHRKEVSTILHLTGHVRYSDGTPAAYRTLELRSEPVRTVTDSSGNFLFDNVPMGEHSLSIINDDGSVAARREIVLDRNQAAAGISIDGREDGTYVVELAVNVRMLEIAIELDAENYTINPEHITYETVDGTVVTPTGTASVLDGPVVTPSGNVCLPDGTIVLPGKGAQTPVAVILPDDTVVYPEVPLNAGEITIAPDGSVKMPDGTVVMPGGEIRRPDGQSHTPGEGGVIVTEEDVIPIGEKDQETADGTSPDQNGEIETAPETQAPDTLPDDTVVETLPASTEGQEEPSASEETKGNDKIEESTAGESTAAPDNGSGGQGGGSGNGGSGNDGGGDNGTTEPTNPTDPIEPTAPTEPEPSTEDPDNGTLDVAGQVKDTTQYISWTQESKIDLFYNRDNPDSPILPGSKGFYLFRLKNTRKEPLTITLTIAEGGNHLPLKFTLSPMTGGQDAVRGSMAGYQSSLELNTTIDAEAETGFKLDWEWPSTGHDREDTEAGKKGGEYMLTLTIHAEGAE